MAADRNDMLMKLVRSNGQPLEAECTVTLGGTDDLTTDFAAGKFFEVQAFGFGAGLDDDDAQSSGAKYARFMNAGAKPVRGYPVDIESVSFSRRMDRGSTLFFQDLCGIKTFESATLVKRRLTGGTAAMQTYLRLDFTDVLMIGLDWSDDGTVIETYKFVCRGVLVKYKPQGTGGTLGAVVPGGWPQK